MCILSKNIFAAQYKHYCNVDLFFLFQIVLLNMLMLTKAISPLLPPNQTEIVAKMLQEEAKYVEEKMVYVS